MCLFMSDELGCHKLSTTVIRQATSTHETNLRSKLIWISLAMLHLSARLKLE